MLKDQDLRIHLLSPKEEKIADVKLGENKEGKLTGAEKIFRTAIDR